jgi:uncharacterized protein (UPF0276 family)
MIAPHLPNGAARPAAPVPACAGIGLRFPHHDHVLATRPEVGWFEVHPENYLGFGPFAEDLDLVRRDYPISLHATGLSLGSADSVDSEHLADIAALCRRIEPGLVSDHLSWSSGGGLHLPDLLPLPYNEESLAVVARNVDRVQTALGRSILIENPSTYLAFADSALTEAQFLGELVARAGCGVLLDVNNVAVTAGNLGEAPVQRLKRLLDHLPPAAVGEIHLAGHAVRRVDDGVILRIDDHGSPVSAEVWSLFEIAIAHLGPKPALIEWDTDIPAFGVLQDEAATAQFLLDHIAWRPAHAAAC